MPRETTHPYGRATQYRGQALDQGANTRKLRINWDFTRKSARKTFGYVRNDLGGQRTRADRRPHGVSLSGDDQNFRVHTEPVLTINLTVQGRQLGSRQGSSDQGKNGAREKMLETSLD